MTATWWQLRRYLQQEGGDGLHALLPALERNGVERPVYTYALHAGWQQYEAGDVRAIDEFQCDYVLTNDHPLSPVRLDAAFVSDLPGLAHREVVFKPTGWTADAAAEYDPIDAFYVPIAGFGELRQAGPVVEIWRVRDVGQVLPRADGARQRLANALLEGALMALASGRHQDHVQLQQRARELDAGAVAGGNYRRRLGWSYKRLGQPQTAAQQWRQALSVEPGNARLWLQLGLLSLADLANPEQAADCFRRVLELDPQHPKGPLLRAFLQGLRG